jgi:hypothetical protein
LTDGGDGGRVAAKSGATALVALMTDDSVSAPFAGTGDCDAEGDAATRASSNAPQ